MVPADKLWTSRCKGILNDGDGESTVLAEAFNALNHTNLRTPNRFVNTPQFGTITEAAKPGRGIQFGLRLSF